MGESRDARVARARRRAGAPPADALARFAHLIAAKRLWLERAIGARQSLAVWPSPSLAFCRTELERVEADWRGWIERLDHHRLASSFAYVNSKGERFESNLADVLVHVLTHGAYHRGQIAADLRGGGEAPAYTDFIHAARTGALA